MRDSEICVAVFGLHGDGIGIDRPGGIERQRGSSRIGAFERIRRTVIRLPTVLGVAHPRILRTANGRLSRFAVGIGIRLRGIRIRLIVHRTEIGIHRHGAGCADTRAVGGGCRNICRTDTYCRHFAVCVHSGNCRIVGTPRDALFRTGRGDFGGECFALAVGQCKRFFVQRNGGSVFQRFKIRVAPVIFGGDGTRFFRCRACGIRAIGNPVDILEYRLFCGIAVALDQNCLHSCGNIQRAAINGQALIRHIVPEVNTVAFSVGAVHRRDRSVAVCQYDFSAAGMKGANRRIFVSRFGFTSALGIQRQLTIRQREILSF